jgi:microcystin degradation protein MlrC
MGGFVQVAREYEGVELVGIESPLFPKTGSGSGWVTEETFEHFVGRMIEKLKAGGKFDGAYLCVHGAMAARGIPRPEAELARRVRAVVGEKARIAGTFDPHGNEDEEFLRHADMAFCVKYFPHYDSHLQGERAARMLVRAIRGDYDPQTATVRVPIISPTVLQWTGQRPWMDLVQRALIWEAREPDAYVNVFFGFPWSDVPDVGMTIQAMTNGNGALAKRIAGDMAEWAWRRRKDLLSTTKIYSMAEGVKRAQEAIAGDATPVILADYSDRSGYATWLLNEIVAQDLPDALIATVTDAEVVARLKNAKAGDAFDMPVGGRFDESAGDPVRITGNVRSVIERAGETWVSVRFGRGNVLVITPYLEQIIEPSTLTAIGFDPAAFKVIAIKSRAHFRRGFDDSGFAETIMLVEPPHPFLGTVHLEALPYRNVDLKQFYPYWEPKFP